MGGARSDHRAQHRVSGELRVALLRGRRGPERVPGHQQATVRDPVHAGRRGVGAPVLGVQPQRQRRPVRCTELCRLGRRLRLYGGQLPCRLPGRPLRLGLLARLHLVHAARRQRAAGPGAASARSTTGGCTRSSSSRRPTAICSTPTSTTGTSRASPTACQPPRRPPRRPRASRRSRSSSTARPRPGAGVAYAWDLDGDGQFDDGTGAHLAHSFAAGTYAVRLRVTDDCGVSAVSAPLTISASETPAAQGAESRAVLTGARVNARLIHRRRPIVERPRRDRGAARPLPQPHHVRGDAWPSGP